MHTCFVVVIDRTGGNVDGSACIACGHRRQPIGGASIEAFGPEATLTSEAQEMPPPARYRLSDARSVGSTETRGSDDDGACAQRSDELDLSGSYARNGRDACDAPLEWLRAWRAPFPQLAPLVPLFPRTHPNRNFGRICGLRLSYFHK